MRSISGACLVQARARSLRLLTLQGPPKVDILLQSGEASRFQGPHKGELQDLQGESDMTQNRNLVLMDLVEDLDVDGAQRR